EQLYQVRPTNSNRTCSLSPVSRQNLGRCLLQMRDLRCARWLTVALSRSGVGATLASPACMKRARQASPLQEGGEARRGFSVALRYASAPTGSGVSALSVT